MRVRFALAALWALFGILTFECAPSATAEMVEVKEETAGEPPVGKEKAQTYFQDRKHASAKKKSAVRAPASEEGDTPRFLALHIGTFFSSQSYKWGHGNQTNPGRLNMGVDYRLGEWVNTADVLLRVDFTTYGLDEGSARKLSIGMIVTFPDANSRFPLYFGAGIGPGFFVQQIHNQSALALDYSLLAGVRFLNVIDQVGFLVETGIKNHIHLFSEGQFNGIYINVGTVFAF